MKGILFLFFVVFLSGISALAQNQARFSGIKPGMKDDYLEWMAIRVANYRGVQYDWHEEYYKAVILSEDWEPDYDKHGFLTSRHIHVELLAHMPSGRCAMTDFIFKQKLQDDDTFCARLYYAGVGDIVYVECE